jgi:hypothetical protein
MRWFWIAILAGMGFSNPTKVAAITYNEAVNGDLPTFIGNSNIFGLDVGTNTFSGEITFAGRADFPLPPTDFDSFVFSIPTENRLESVLLSISLLSGSSGLLRTIGYELQASPFNNNIIADESITIPSTNLSLFTLGLPLESGLFGLQNSFLSGSLQQGEFQTVTYTFSLNVAATQTVPEPTSVVGLLAFSTYGVVSVFKKKQGFRQKTDA